MSLATLFMFCKAIVEGFLQGQREKEYRINCCNSNIKVCIKLEPKCYVPAISETKVRRRGFGEDGIYLDAARNRYMGAISLGLRL